MGQGTVGAAGAFFSTRRVRSGVLVYFSFQASYRVLAVAAVADYSCRSLPFSQREVYVSDSINGSLRILKEKSKPLEPFQGPLEVQLLNGPLQGVLATGEVFNDRSKRHPLPQYWTKGDPPCGLGEELSIDVAAVGVGAGSFYERRQSLHWHDHVPDV